MRSRASGRRMICKAALVYMLSAPPFFFFFFLLSCKLRVVVLVKYRYVLLSLSFRLRFATVKVNFGGSSIFVVLVLLVAAVRALILIMLILFNAKADIKKNCKEIKFRKSDSSLACYCIYLSLCQVVWDWSQMLIHSRVWGRTWLDGICGEFEVGGQALTDTNRRGDGGRSTYTCMYAQSWTAPLPTPLWLNITTSRNLFTYGCNREH